MRFDKNALINLAPINGENYQKLLAKFKLNQVPDSIIFYSKNKISYKGKAVLDIIQLLGFPFAILLVLKIIPLPILNFLYDLVAVNRYKVFGRHDTCPIIPAQYKQRFLH